MTAKETYFQHWKQWVKSKYVRDEDLSIEDMDGDFEHVYEAMEDYATSQWNAAIEIAEEKLVAVARSNFGQSVTDWQVRNELEKLKK